MTADLEGKVAVVTGGASGIGEGIVRRVIADGGRCVIADIQDEPGMALAAEFGDTARFIHTDVTSEAEVSAAVALAGSEFGSLDCMFNNAGIVGAVGSLIDTPRTAWDSTLAVLLTSVFLGIREAGRVMLPQGRGAIINTASTAGVRAGLGPHAYTAAKHGVVGLTQSAAVEFAAHGVRVNCIAPGRTVSAMTAQVVSGDPTALAAVGAHLTSKASAGRAAYPRDIAAAAVFLAGDDAWYVNGACLVIDGTDEVLAQGARKYFDAESGVLRAGEA